MSDTTARSPIDIFLSYSHRDKTRKDRILEYLEPLQREGLATIWTDDRISLGAQWDEQIRKRIEQSQIALVLVSMPFLNSPYCRTVEIAKFLELRSARGLLIVPVILFECDWKNEPWLAQTQAFPGEDKTLFGNYSRPAALAKALQRLLDRLRDELKANPAAPVTHTRRRSPHRRHRSRRKRAMTPSSSRSSSRAIQSSTPQRPMH